MTTKIGQKVKIISMNCQGLRNMTKRKDVINYLKLTCADIICLQDTHLVGNDISLTRTLWKGEIYQSGISTNLRGVAILINNTFEYHIIETKTDTDGNMLCLKLQIYHMSVLLINVYGMQIRDSMKAVFFS